MDKEIHDFISSNAEAIRIALIALSAIGLILFVWTAYLSIKIHLRLQQIEFLKERKAELENELLYLKSLKK